MKALLKFLLFFIFITGCTKEFILDVRVNPPNSGTVFLLKELSKTVALLLLMPHPMQSMFFLIGLVMLVEVTLLLMSI